MWEKNLLKKSGVDLDKIVTGTLKNSLCSGLLCDNSIIKTN